MPDWEEHTTLGAFVEEAAGRWSAREALTVVIVAESGIALARFVTAPRLATWAGVAPGQDASAGQQRSGNTWQGPRSVWAVRTPRAHAAVPTTGTSLAALVHRLAARRGQQRALMAGAHAIRRRVFPRLARLHRPAHWGRTLVPSGGGTPPSSGVPGGWHTAGTGCLWHSGQ